MDITSVLGSNRIGFEISNTYFCNKTTGMEVTDKKEVANKAYRLLAPYTDSVDMAKKILLIYNGYLQALGKDKSIMEKRHINLLAYYFVFGYSEETKRKFSYCFSIKPKYIAVMDCEMKNKGLLVDLDGTFKTRRLCREINDMRELFLNNNSRDMAALAILFFRKQDDEL